MLATLSHRWSRRSESPLDRLRFALIATTDLLWSAFLLWIAHLAISIRAYGSGIGRELRVVLRGLGKAPGFSLTVLAVLATTVGVNAAVFSYVRGTFFDPPPYAEPDEIVIAWGSRPSNGQLRDVISGSVYMDLALGSRSLTSIAAVHGDEVVLMEDGRPAVVEALEVTVGFLGVLGVSPAMGRDFGETDRTSGGEATAIVSHAFWRDRMGAVPEAVGSAIEMDGGPTTVIGVLPEDFRFYAPANVLVPLRDDLLAAEERTHFHYHVLGRLRPGDTPATAGRELTGILATVAEADPRLASWSVRVERLEHVSVESVRPALWVLSIAVGLVLLIAIANLATLFRLRTLSRLDEMSVRLALGAGRRRIARLLLTEACVLSLMGGLIGVALTPALLKPLADIAPSAVPIPESAAMVTSLRVSLDVWVRIAAVGVAVAAGVILTLPSLVTLGRIAHASVAVRSGAPTGSGVRAGYLVGAELVLATLLCMGAGLSVRSAGFLGAQELGVDPEGVLSLYFGDVGGRTVDDRVQYYRAALEAVERVPGVIRAGINDYLPFMGEDDFTGIRFPDRPAPAPGAGVREEWRRVSDGTFEASGMQIRSGRGFGREDFHGRPRVIVVNQAFAAKHFQGEAVVGRRISLSNRAYREVEIVGVVSDVLARGPALPPPPTIYAPFQGSPRGHVGLYAKVEGDPLAYVGLVRDAIWSVEGTQPIVMAQPLVDLVRQATAVPRMIRSLVTSLAVIALLLAGMGVFGVLGHAIRSRRSELGVRMALGATTRLLAGGLVRQTAPLVLVGIGTGLILGVFAGRAAGAVLHGVGAIDVPSMLGAAGAMATIALVATTAPLRRMRDIDPIEVIRAD